MTDAKHRLKRERAPSILNYQPLQGPDAQAVQSNVVIQCGWGRLIFGHTFSEPQPLVDELRREEDGTRDLALYLRDPHVVLSLAPQELFLDPSHTYRLWLNEYRASRSRPPSLLIRRVQSEADVFAMNQIYHQVGMVTLDPRYVVDARGSKVLSHFVAEDDGEIVGAVVGVDHVNAFGDPEAGSSLWSLAVAPSCQRPGLGDILVRHLAEHYQARGRAFMDLSVFHDNDAAIKLYENLGFRRVPVFCVKRRNRVNESLFVGPNQDADLNPYAQIIVDEARRRGIAVRVMDASLGVFELEFGGRSVRCRESLTDLTSAVAMTLCTDKKITTRLIREAGLSTPRQMVAGDEGEELEFLETVGAVVVKPATGEQGTGVAVNVQTPAELKEAIKAAAPHGETVLLEEFVQGLDLRVLVIGHEVVAAAVRHPPVIIGSGRHTARQLIEKLSRRRAAATGGESTIPVNQETLRCLQRAGHDFQDIIPDGKKIPVRSTANLHTGATLEDVTNTLHPALAAASVHASRILDLPVVGLDFIVPALDQPPYWFIEANERPGLANHEPAPTAQRFIDLLFPQTMRTDASGASPAQRLSWT